MTTAIEARSVTKTYGEGEAAVHALSGVDLDVRQGEVLLLMGPSGSGKTTLLQILGCILKPTAGTVRVGGKDLAALTERDLPRLRREHIGFVFQGFNLFPTLTALENVMLALDVNGVRGREARRRSSEVLERVGLGDKLDASPANLSGGQKQRVSIARALVSSPSVILADEPTAALDSSSGRMVMDLLRDLAHERQRAVAIVTHDDRTLSYADRIARIEDGRLHEVTGTAKEAEENASCLALSH